MDKGWALVGDAGAFMDPYYSPGLDHASMSVWATVDIIRRELAGELAEADLVAAIDRHNGQFFRSYDGWLDALYTNTYELMGDAELTAAAFLFDTGMYYLGVVGGNQRDLAELAVPAFGCDDLPTRLARWTMVAFNRRLVKLARFRRAVGTYGKRNLGWRLYPARFDIARDRALALVRSGLKLWWGVEREYLAHRLLLRRRVDLSPPVPLGDGETVEELAAQRSEQAVVAVGAH